MPHNKTPRQTIPKPTAMETAAGQEAACGGLLSCWLHPPGSAPPPASMAEFMQGFTPWNLLSIPWWLQYALHAYEEDPYHMMTEFALVMFVLFLLLRRPYSPGGSEKPLSSKEQDELIKEWQPEPLVPEGALGEGKEEEEEDVIRILERWPALPLFCCSYTFLFALLC